MKKITHKATLLERIENAIKKRIDKFQLSERSTVKGGKLSWIPVARTNIETKIKD